MKIPAAIAAVLLFSAPVLFAHHHDSATRADAIAMIARLGGTISPTKVDLHKSQVTDEDLALLAAMPDLQELDLRLTNVTDAGVKHLHDLRKLRFLNLFRTQMTDAGLASLQPLGELETLLIGGTKVTDAGLVALQAHPHLRKLS
jgi:hypothetical protein